MQLEGRRLQGRFQRYKHRLVLRDVENDDQVTCGPKQVSSEDLAIVENGAGQWQIAAWGLNCELERCGEAVRIRFFDSGSKALYFGIEL
jgi:hypothetical protein